MSFEKILEGRSAAVQEVARAARSLIFEVLPQTVEVVWEKQKNAGYGTGPKKQTQHFSWIMPHAGHVNLGFNYGAELSDPQGLLEGTGALFRHVKLRSLDDLRRPGLRALLQQAVAHRAQEGMLDRR